MGGRSATAGANVGQTLLSGGMSAAKTLQAANSYSPLGSTISGLSQNPYVYQGLNNYFNPTSSTAGTYGLGGYGANANYGFGSGSSGVDYGFGSTGSSYGLQPTGGLGLTFQP